MGYPETCELCTRDASIPAGLGRELALAVRPFIGSKPTVMVVGQDPTLMKRDVGTVLELDKPTSRLYRFIAGDILEPVGIDLARDVYATNLIKCRFPNKETPRILAKNHGVSMTQFLSPFFQNCKGWFLEELQEINPRIVISLGQPVHQMLVSEFSLSVPIKMKDAFGRVCAVSVLDHGLFYVPCIHYNSRAHLHYKNLWGAFQDNLRKVVLDSS